VTARSSAREIGVVFAGERVVVAVEDRLHRWLLARSGDVR
jgi:hypothetical protein